MSGDERNEQSTKQTGEEGTSVLPSRRQEQGPSRPGWGQAPAWDGPQAAGAVPGQGGDAHAEPRMTGAPPRHDAGNQWQPAPYGAGQWAGHGSPHAGAPVAGASVIRPQGAPRGQGSWLGWVAGALSALVLLGIALPWLTISVDGTPGDAKTQVHTEVGYNGLTDLRWTDDAIRAWTDLTGEIRSRDGSVSEAATPGYYGVEEWGAGAFQVEIILIVLLTAAALVIAGSAATRRALWKSVTVSALALVSLILGIIAAVQVADFQNMVHEAVMKASNGEYGSSGQLTRDGADFRYGFEVGPGPWLLTIGLAFLMACAIAMLVMDLRVRRGYRAVSALAPGYPHQQYQA